MSKNLEILVKEMEKIHPHYTIAEVGKILELGRKLLADEQAQKPEAPASFMSDIKKWWDTRPLRTSKGEIIPGSPYKNVDEWSMAFSEIYCRYRPAPSSDEGLRKALDMKKNELLSSPYATSRLIGKWFEDILSRPPSTAKSEDRCGELERAIALMNDARGHGGPTAYHDAEDSVGYYVCCGKVSYEAHSKDCWYRKMCEFLDEFSKDADGKE